MCATCDARRPHQKFVARLKLCLDFLADLVVGNAQVLSDVAVVGHQAHEVVGDVEQLRSERVVSGVSAVNDNGQLASITRNTKVKAVKFSFSGHIIAC